MWCNLMLTDISYEFYISQMYSSACLLRGPHPHNQKSQQVKQRMYISGIHHVYLGVLTPTTKRVNKSSKGCIFQVGTWWVYMGWYQCLRDLVTQLETPQFALYFDILDSCVQ